MFFVWQVLASDSTVMRADLDGDGRKERQTTTVTQEGVIRRERVCVASRTANGCVDKVTSNESSYLAYRLEGEATWFDLPCILDARDHADPRQAAFIGPLWMPGQAVSQIPVCFEGRQRPKELSRLVGDTSSNDWVLAPVADWFGTDLVPVDTQHIRYDVATLGPMVVLVDKDQNRHRWIGAWNGHAPQSIRLEGGTLKLVGAENTTLTLDMNGLGELDASSSEDTCIPYENGGHVACVRIREQDGAVQVISATPPENNRAVVEAGLDCVSAEPNNPAHGVSTINGWSDHAWVRGPLVDQESVCVGDSWKHASVSGPWTAVASDTAGVSFHSLGRYLAVVRGKDHLIVEVPDDNPVVRASLSKGRLVAFDAKELSHQWEVPDDHNGDGVIDPYLSDVDWGSGWSRSVGCFKDGATGHLACREFRSTSYGRMHGRREAKREPASGNRAVELWEPLCEQTVVDSAAFGSIWLLAHEASTRWFAGRPVDQASGCLPEHPLFVGATTWSEGDELTEEQGWEVFYGNAWRGEGSGRTPVEIGGTKDYRLYQHAHSVAVYDVQADQHRWVFNAERWVRVPHKLDRWETIGAVSIDGMDVVVSYSSYDGEQADTVRVGIRSAKGSSGNNHSD